MRIYVYYSRKSSIRSREEQALQPLARFLFDFGAVPDSRVSARARVSPGYYSTHTRSLFSHTHTQIHTHITKTKEKSRPTWSENSNALLQGVPVIKHTSLSSSKNLFFQQAEKLRNLLFE